MVNRAGLTLPTYSLGLPALRAVSQNTITLSRLSVTLTSEAVVVRRSTPSQPGTGGTVVVGIGGKALSVPPLRHPDIVFLCTLGVMLPSTSRLDSSAASSLVNS